MWKGGLEDYSRRSVWPRTLPALLATWTETTALWIVAAVERARTHRVAARAAVNEVGHKVEREPGQLRAVQAERPLLGEVRHPGCAGRQQTDETKVALPELRLQGFNCLLAF